MKTPTALKYTVHTNVVIAATFLCAGALFMGCQVQKETYVTVLFEERNNLQVHDPVYYKSVQIGEVSAIGIAPDPESGNNGIGARVTLQAHYLTLLHRDMDFVASPESWRRMSIVIKDKESIQRVDLKPFDTVKGKPYRVYLREEAEGVVANIWGLLQASL